MSLINSDVIPASATASYYDYTIDQSLRFNDDDSAYLSRTPSSAGNRRTWTWSAWVKKATNSFQTLFSARTTSSSSDICYIGFNSTTQELFFVSDNGVGYVKSTALYRDTTSHYHICVSVDTTQATASNRVKLYINGSQLTDLSQSTYPAQNLDTAINNTIAHSVGRRNHTSDLAYFDGYMAEVNFIDGQALDPTYFGETGDYGEWKPIEYTGTYGNNGFYLNFSDSGSIGTDSSGNGNNWTANNLSATDVVLDSPTNNFATMNPLRMSTTAYLAGATQGTFSEGNLKVLGASGGTGSAGYMNECATMTMDKWYAEARIETAGCQIGVMDESYTGGSYGGLNGTGTICISGSNIVRNNANVYTGLTHSAGDVIGVAMNHTSEKVWFSINGVWQGSGTQNPATGDGGYSTSGVGTNMFFALGDGGSDANGGIANFGQDSSFAGNKTVQGNTDGNGIGDFYYTPPTGYLALCNENLPDDDTFELLTGEQPSDHFNTVLYTGDGSSSRAITGVGFQPDLIWLKQRNGAGTHEVFDSVRGNNGTVYYRLLTQDTGAEDTAANTVFSLNSDGFTVGSDGNTNGSGDTMVAWCWKAGGTPVSNTDGSITSSVSANQDAGFSIVSYSGATNSTSDSSNNGGSYWTIGHGLTKAPELIIVKKRSSAASWYVGSDYLGGTTPWADGKHLTLNTSAAVANEDPDGVLWGNTAPTSSVFTVGGWDVVNRNGTTYISYCFHSVDGFSKIGSYTGNGSADGPFVYTGFRPAFVMCKVVSGVTGSWNMFDSARDSYNEVNGSLLANSSSTEDLLTSQNDLDFLSNGFKIRETNNNFNGSGNTYIYMAFAEDPFKYGNAR